MASTVPLPLLKPNWDSLNCVPSDFCQLGLHDCHPEHGVCSLTGHQAFSCRCRVGKVGDGTHCERTSCPDFPVAEPQNGFFSCSIPTSSAANTCQSANSTEPEYEVVCVLHCNHGYDRLIYAEYSCRHDGNWTIPVDIYSAGSTPCLAVKCPDLSCPLHGRMTCDSGSYFRYPEICSFACDVNPGYELTPTSSSVRHCQADATWSGNDAECIGVWCPALSSPTNGRMSCNSGYSFRYPETCTFRCNHGYHLSAGSTSRTCQADGKWSGRAARCCPDGYNYYRRSQFCYRAFNQRKNYNDAAATCSSDGGTLAMPRNAGINAFLVDLKNAMDNTALFWFGLTDRATEGSWVWADGVELANEHFKQWGPRQPDNAHDNENCAHYWQRNHEQVERRNRWNDLLCSETFLKFICQVGT
ncbi:sushi, von Willebrand factor type A, EGF and pentraxin domain-containing protein 1-like [Branchiostoma floridae]|uniref:Sushi, von Willebrand factor type A, EGF and pentraxin domain-containing protein 1-like n=2 Tax=Branchiostoma floridae TaxID=7739 RepID=A0A9J7N0A3_BRAFL|nr:sushi, von Willebrand factor type A, EGF and pentraxin domain-containing protein 1-like [Branchiostoma floridae]